MDDVSSRAARIRLLMLDVDGVLTDGRLYFSASGEEMKVFHSRDGHGLKMLRESGVEVAIITGRSSRAVERRAAELGIARLYQGVEDKGAVLEELLAELGLEAAAAAFMGDDVVDLPVMRRCGLALSVPDAPEMVRQHAHYVTAHAAGAGAVREACELIMAAQGTLQARLASYLA
jgi:3-deoxy-D-manno-octulosonate 8-phosphate phosphatase (KDO 8-P phosphatase)